MQGASQRDQVGGGWQTCGASSHRGNNNPQYYEVSFSLQLFFSMIYILLGSWGSGANIWGPEKDEKFTKPNHWDGVLEVVGVQGHYTLQPIKFPIATSSARCNCDQRKYKSEKCNSRCRPLGPDSERSSSRHSHRPRKSYQNSYEQRRSRSGDSSLFLLSDDKQLLFPLERLMGSRGSSLQETLSSSNQLLR